MKRIAVLLLLTMNAFGAGRELEITPGRGATPNYTSAAQTAFANGRFLTVWHEAMGELGMPVMGVLHDGSALRLSERAFPILPSARFVKLVGAGGSFALFWHDGTQSFLTDIDRNGSIAQTTPLDVTITLNTIIAWNGTRFLIHERQYVPALMTEAVLLSRAGAIVAHVPPLPSYPSGYSVAPALRGFTLATAGPERNVCASSVNNAGEIEWTACTAASSSVSETPVAAMVEDRGALLIWTGADYELHSSIVRDGAFGEIRAVTTGVRPARPVQLGFAGDRFLLTFTRMEAGAPLMSLPVYPDGSPGAVMRTVTPARGSNVSVASSGKATLAVFDDQSVPPRTSQVVIANNGTATLPHDIMIGGVPSQPVLADAGSHLLAVWSDDFDREGKLVSSALRPGESLWWVPFDRGQLASRKLPSNGSELLVLSVAEVERVPKLQASFVALDGDLRDGPVVLADMNAEWPMRTAAGVWTGQQWLAVWKDPGHSALDVAVVHPTVATTRTLDVGTPVPPYSSREFPYVALTRNATTTLFAWTESHTTYCELATYCNVPRYHTYAARITPDGTLASAPIELPSSGASLSVATSGDEFVVVAGGAATVIDSGVRRILRTTMLFDFDGAAGDVTWTGLDYAVAMRIHLAKWYLNVAHLDRAGNVIGAPQGIETLGAQTLSAPSIARSVIALQEGDWTRGTHAVVYEEPQLAPLPPPPAHPSPRFVRKEEHWYEVTWDAVPGAELYVAELPEDWGTRTVIVRSGNPLRVFAYSASVSVIAVGPGGTSSPPSRRRVARR